MFSYTSRIGTSSHCCLSSLYGIRCDLQGNMFPHLNIFAYYYSFFYSNWLSARSQQVFLVSWVLLLKCFKILSYAYNDSSMNAKLYIECIFFLILSPIVPVCTMLNNKIIIMMILIFKIIIIINPPKTLSVSVFPSSDHLPSSMIIEPDNHIIHFPNRSSSSLCSIIVSAEQLDVYLNKLTRSRSIALGSIP